MMVAAKSQRTRFWAIVQRRCPACREGRVFRSLWTMNEDCPVCGVHFTRGPGYFTGAMYFSYALGIPIIALLTLIAYLIWPSWHLYQDVLIAWLVFLPLVPAVFQYSRVLWIHFDRYFDPERES